MNIIHCPRRFTLKSWGGTETCLANLAQQQQRSGLDVKVLTTKALDPAPRDKILGIDVRRYSYLYPYLGISEDVKLQMDYSGGNLFSLPLLRALIGSEDVSLLHAHSAKRLGGIVRTAAKIKNIPYVISLHGGMFNVPGVIRQNQDSIGANGFEWGKALGALVGSRRVLNDASVIFCVSKGEARAAQSALPGARVEYMPNGVDCEKFNKPGLPDFREKFAIPGDARVVLNVGRIDPQKNQHLLVDALPLMLRQQANVHLVLIGHITDAEYHKALLNRVRALNLQAHVTIVPGLNPDSPDLIAAYKTAEIFCLPSIHEPFGIVVLEAWAAGTPVIASRTGGIPDFTRDRQDIILVDDYNRHCWAKHIMALLDSPLRFHLAEQAKRKAVSEYDWQHINERLLGIYREVCR